MKFTSVIAAFTLLTLAACSNDNGGGGQPRPELPALGAIDGEVELEVRNGANASTDNYVQATYSFLLLTRDNVELTRNGWDIQLGPGTDGSGGEDYFHTEMVVDDIGIIEDLGKMSCKDISLPEKHQSAEYKDASAGGYPHPKHRQTAPEFWFRYTDESSLLQDSKTEQVVVTEGHCYVLRKVSSDSDVKAVFRVKKHEKNKSVTIDEIEVFERKWR